MLSPQRRDDESCPPNQNYYRCSSVSYTGCCTHDPCSSNSCTDDTAQVSSESCAVYTTVTVTQTLWQGSATSTVDATGAESSSVPSATDEDEPTFGATAISGQSGADTVVSLAPTSVDSAGTATGTAHISSSTITSTPSVTSVTLSGTVPTTKTLNLVSKSSASTTGSHAKSTDVSASASTKSSTPPATTIAGSVVGSMAGLALIALLLLWCLKRRKQQKKVSLSFNRTVKNNGGHPTKDDVEAIKKERDLALQNLEHNNNALVPSPRSFDFGLPTIPQGPAFGQSTIPRKSPPIVPGRWL